MSKEIIKQKQEALLDLVAAFCAQKLNEEYLKLADKLIKKMARKKEVPFLRGKLEIWAAGVIHALGSVNWMFDRSNEWYIPADDINAFFGTNKSTVSQKATLIRDLFGLDHFKDEWTTKATQDVNPLNNFVMVDGLIMTVSMLPEELREQLKKARAEGGDMTFKTK